jgi:formamidopyrimidine-DNA glycosylase
MPELPEVQMVVTTLRPALLGKAIRRVHVTRADIIRPAGIDLAALLKGQRVTEVARRGKKIVVTVGDSQRFYVHLGMTGRLTLEAPGADVKKHTHVSMDLDGFQVRFQDPRRFGGIWWLGTDLPVDSELGPEPLTMRPKQLAAALSRTRRVIKSALLDQSMIAGLGNIYADEALFAAKIHPLTPANELTTRQVAALNRAIKTTLRRALRHRGSTLRDYRDAEGNAGTFQRLHRVYDRAGKPCQICRTPIQRIVIGGRSSHFCPKCQVGSTKRS